MPRVFHTPGVYREEIDLSEILVPTGISNGGMVIRSKKGPVNRPVLVTNDKEFVETFGEPYFASGTNENHEDVTNESTRKLIPEYGYGSYAALEFLKESQNLYIVRGFDSGAAFANADVLNELDTSAYKSSAISAISVSAKYNQESPDRIDKIQSIDEASENMKGALLVAALYPGDDGNRIAVTIEAPNSACDWRYNYDNFSSAISPDVDFATYYPLAAKVFKICVYERGKTTTGWSNYIDHTVSAVEAVSGLRITPVETFYGTLVEQLDGNNNQLYIENVINGVSKYIYVKTGSISAFSVINPANRPVSSDDVGDFVYLNRLIPLSSGVYNQGDGIDDTNGWSLFKDRELTNVGILICTSWNDTVKKAVSEVVASRLDCIAALQVGTPEDNSVTAVQDAEKYGYVEPSYIALYAGFSKIYDNYNAKYVYIPNSIFGGSLMARVDNIANPWNAPAGIDRATMAVLDQLKVFSFNEIGQLYDVNINVPRFIRGTGYVMWGQKTAQMKKSALDRINVRRMLLYIENNIEISLLPFVFENNTDKTRLRIFSLVDEFMATVQAGGGVTKFEVVCDETNNTPTVIDSNQLAVDLYVQPTRVAEFIKFTTVVTRTGISFSDVRITTA